MITTQSGFQANSRIITTTDEMLEELPIWCGMPLTGEGIALPVSINAGGEAHDKRTQAQ